MMDESCILAEEMSAKRTEKYRDLMIEDLEFIKETLKTGNRQNKEESFIRISRLLNCSPDKPIYLFYLGTLLLSENNYGAAIPPFRYCISKSEGKLKEAIDNLELCYKELNKSATDSKSKSLMDEDLSYVKNSLQKNDVKDKREAFVRISRLLDYEPDKPVYLYYMGTLLLAEENFGPAMVYFKACLHSCKGNMPEGLNNLGLCYRMMGDFDSAQKLFESALHLRPSSTYYGNVASYYVGNGTPDKAIELCKKGLEAGEIEDNNCLLNNLSNAYLEKGMYKEAWQIYGARFKIEGPHREKHRKDYGLPVWDGTKGQTIIVSGEQGIGDEIMFASVLPDVMKDCNVIFDCHDRLVSLFRNSFPNIPVFGTKRMFEATWHRDQPIDAQIAVGSLCKYYRNSESDFPGTPYLKAEDDCIRFCLNRLKEAGLHQASRFRVGFSWKGGTSKTYKHKRHNKLENWVEMFKQFSDVDFISLQYNEDSKDILDAFCKEHGVTNVYHWDDIMADYSLTAGLLALLSCVISVPQSVVHLAGAMGVTTLQLTPYHSLWQMGVKGKNMPWYSNVKNVWMENPDDWPGVMKLAKEELWKLSQKTIAA